jgi:hypothetical protein
MKFTKKPRQSWAERATDSFTPKDRLLSEFNAGIFGQDVCKLSWPMILKLLPFLPVPTKMVKHREQGGRVNMPVLLGDLLLFFCLAAWVTGIVIAIASLLS